MLLAEDCCTPIQMSQSPFRLAHLILAETATLSDFHFYI